MYAKFEWIKTLFLWWRGGVLTKLSSVSSYVLQNRSAERGSWTHSYKHTQRQILDHPCLWLVFVFLFYLALIWPQQSFHNQPSFFSSRNLMVYFYEICFSVYRCKVWTVDTVSLWDFRALLISYHQLSLILLAPTGQLGSDSLQGKDWSGLEVQVLDGPHTKIH